MTNIEKWLRKNGFHGAEACWKKYEEERKNGKKG